MTISIYQIKSRKDITKWIKKIRSELDLSCFKISDGVKEDLIFGLNNMLPVVAINWDEIAWSDEARDTHP
jgi:hypothetical protein